MDTSIVKKVKKVMRTLDMGLSPAETHRAIYDYAVHEFGADRVGEFDFYLRRTKGHWTLERCQEIALKYSSKSEWRESVDSASWQAAHNKGWIDQCCEHMEGLQKPRGYWTLDLCQAAALKYSSKTEWADSPDSPSHTAAYRYGWLELCCEHMEGKRPNGYWTLELCQTAALKYSNKTDWKESADRAAYAQAYRNNWIDLCCTHMDVKKKPNGYWTLEKCKEVALRYSSKTEWGDSEDGSSYVQACRNGWVDLCCEHMNVKKKPDGYWTFEKCKESALKYSSKAEWRKNQNAAFLAAKKKGFLEICHAHMDEGKKPNGYWNIERCKEVALKYSSKTEWHRSQDKSAYAYAKINGFFEICCDHMIKKG
jgi:hypothetical protein